jgi:hypothetical protein
MNLLESAYIFWEQHYSHNDPKYDSRQHATIILSALLFFSVINIITIVSLLFFHKAPINDLFNMLEGSGLIRRFISIPLFYVPFYIFCFLYFGKRKKHWALKRKFLALNDFEKKNIKKTGLLISLFSGLLFIITTLISILI